MSRGIFITGTDTGVGKTEIACAIVRLLRARGVDVGVMKPVASGCGVMGGRVLSVDTLRLVAAAQVEDTPEQVTPVAYQAPLAPAAAARLENVPFDPERISAGYRRIAERHEFVLVEGIGGVLVPLDETTLLVDLIGLLDLPVLIVARAGLGTINHTLLSVRECVRQGVEVRGVIFSQTASGAEDPSIATNARLVEAYAGVPVLGQVPYLSDMRALDAHLEADALVAALLGPEARAVRSE